MSRLYPDHIYDSGRIQIAAELIQHELRKLLPAVPANLWPAVDSNVADWFSGDAFELAPVHDYWNAADGIMRGFKLKGLVRYITAENVVWSQAAVPLETIDLPWEMPVLASLGKPPYDSRRLLAAIAADPALRQMLTSNSDRHAASSHPRDHYPVVLLTDGGGRLTVGDGNRRVLRALLHDRPHVQAWVGRLPKELMRNYWVSTGFLRQLGEQAVAAREAGDYTAVEGIRRTVGLLFAQTSIARTNFDLRVKLKYPLLEP